MHPHFLVSVVMFSCCFDCQNLLRVDRHLGFAFLRRGPVSMVKILAVRCYQDLPRQLLSQLDVFF